VPGKINFYGSTFIGRPVLTTGWNEYLGWSHTVNYPDLEEIYELSLDPERPDHYLFDGGSVPLERDDSEIAVRDGNSRTNEKFTFWHTPLGPVIHKTKDKAYVLRSACWENYRAYEQWLKMTQTKNFDEFRKVVSMNQIPMFNICYADRAGNIYYLYNGTVPKLPHERQTTKAIPASRTADIWTDFLRTDELPQLVNPPGGYVQNSNSPPFYTNLKALLNPADFPPYLRENNVSLRTQHGLELISGDEKLSLEDLRERKHSPRILVADRVKGDLLAALGDSSANDEFTAAAALLEAWDNTVKTDSRGATLFVEWWKRYEQAGGQFAVAWNTGEPLETPRGLADPELARTTFREAMSNVERRFGAIDVAWGDAHRFRKGPVDLPLSGGSGLMGCFRVLDFHEDADGKES
jgi:acyl-homoserine-lactone acylase